MFGGAGFVQHFGATNQLVNNIFALSSGAPLEVTEAEDHLSFTFEHNLIVSTNAAFFSGPWDELNYVGRSNCYTFVGKAKPLFPTGELAAWQKLGREKGSVLADVQFVGNWPDVTLPPRSAAEQVGFQPFDPKLAGVYGNAAWVRLAGTQ